MSENKTTAAIELLGIMLALGIGLFYVYEYTHKPVQHPTPIVEEPAPVKKALELTASSYLLVVYDGNKLHTLESHNENVQHRIASVTKLMTALIADTKLPKEYELTFRKEDVAAFGSSGFFKEGDKLKKSDALSSLLIESNNDVARAFASFLPSNQFLETMNKEAEILGMKSTLYRNSSGLDGISTSTSNISTAADLALLAKEYVDNHRELLALTTLKESRITFANGSFSHVATATDHLLSDSSFPLTILGGKTGDTPKAKKNLVLIAMHKDEPLVYIGVVLFADDHFADMKKLFGTLSSN